MTAPRSPIEESASLVSSTSPRLETGLRALISARVKGDAAEYADAMETISTAFAESLALADLFGRRRIQLLADAAERSATLSAGWTLGGALAKIPFAEAVRDILTRMPEIASGWRAVAEVYRERHGFACARAADVAVTERVRDLITKGLSTDDRLGVRTAIDRLTGWRTAYTDTVYETTVRTAYSAGMVARQRAPEVARVLPGFEFISAKLVTSRPNHMAAHGLIAGTDDPVWHSFTPPLGFRCFLPGTTISGRINAGVRSSYSGQAVELHTRHGARLRVTANHPVLTGRGWIAAALVREGDEVLSDLRDIHALHVRDLLATPLPSKAVRAVDDHDGPSAVEDVFDALAAKGATGLPVRAHSLPLDLHGDALFAEREVHVVRADGRLPRDAASEPRDGVHDLPLVEPEPTRLSVRRRGPTASLLERDHALATGIPRGGARSSHALPVVGELLREPPRRSLRLGHAARLDAPRKEDATDDAARSAEFACELVLRCSGQIARDQIIRVRNFDWTGHVYDLQSDLGWIVSSGMVTSNCACSLRPVTVYEARRGDLLDSAGRLRTIYPPTWGSAAPDPGFGRGRPDVRAASGFIG